MHRMASILVPPSQIISGTLKPAQRVHCIIPPWLVVARGLSLLWQEGTRAGSQVRERGAVGLRRVGSAVNVFVIGLISGGFLLDGGETGDAVKRIRLYFEPGIGDLLAAAATDAV